MGCNVHDIHIAVKRQCSPSAIFSVPPRAHNVCMANTRHFLREWRKHRDKTLEQVAEHLHMTHGSLSKIERGKVPYNQKLLEALADLYMCEPADLIIRDPTDPDGIWSIWDNAKPGERAKIVSIARTILGEGDKGAA